MTHRIAVALLSGGVDSTACLYHAYAAHPAYSNVVAVSVNYGQRHLKETDYAIKTCGILGISHYMLQAPNIFPKSMLTDTGVAVPDISYSDIEGVSPTYVPFRNGTMLSLITAFTEGLIEKHKRAVCESMGNDIQPGEEPECEADIYFGAHAEDAANWAYPDCTPEFIGAMANAIYIGSYRRIRLVTPLEWMNKTDIILHGQKLGVRWENTWSCYKGLEKQCGICPTCRSRREGFVHAHIADPTEYAA